MPTIITASIITLSALAAAAVWLWYELTHAATDAEEEARQQKAWGDHCAEAEAVGNSWKGRAA